MNILVQENTIIETASDRKLLSGILKQIDPAIVETVDLPDRYVLPGMCNTHVHLTFSATTETLSDYLSESELTKGIRAAANAQTLLKSGVTTVRDAGSGDFLFSISEAVRKDVIKLPRLILCGTPITRTGGHLHYMGGEADGTDAVRKRVRSRKKLGAGAVKIIASGGNLTPGTKPEKSSYSQQELNAAVAEANSLDLPTLAHCLSPDSIRLAVRSGIGCIDHCAFIVRNSRGWLERRYEKDVALELRDSDSYFTMSLALSERLESIRRKKQITENEAFDLEQDARRLEIFGRLVDLGIKPVVGTDTGVPNTLFHETSLELLHMVKGGLSPEGAIEAATTSAAQAMGMGDKIGQIAAGFYADLIAVPNNPLKDISVLSKVDWVMADGEIIRRNGQKGFI